MTTLLCALASLLLLVLLLRPLLLLMHPPLLLLMHQPHQMLQLLVHCQELCAAAPEHLREEMLDQPQGVCVAGWPGPAACGADYVAAARRPVPRRLQAQCWPASQAQRLQWLACNSKWVMRREGLHCTVYANLRMGKEQWSRSWILDQCIATKNSCRSTGKRHHIH